MADALERTGRLHELEFDGKNHSLMVRGEAYPHQLEEMAVGLYGEHDCWFQETLGFTIPVLFGLAPAFQVDQTPGVSGWGRPNGSGYSRWRG